MLQTHIADRIFLLNLPQKSLVRIVNQRLSLMSKKVSILPGGDVYILINRILLKIIPLQTSDIHDDSRC